MAPRFRESETPHFFKVILKEHNDLQIPKKFVRAHERDFTDMVRLEVAGGDTWDMKLFKQDGEFFLQDGWADFKSHYDIKHGHFVIFRYEGGSKFHVVICDISACEINYPPKPTDQPGDCDTAVQEPNIGAKLGPPVEARKNLRMRSSHPTMMAPTGPDIHKGTFGSHVVSNSSRRGSLAFETAQKSGALLRASSLQCKWPSYPSNKFVRTFIPKAKNCGDLKLCTSGERSWTVGYSINGWCPRIERGWKKFAVDNNLRVGDVCVFESLGGAELAFCVSIFQSHPEGVAQPCPSSRPKRSRKFDGAVSSNSGHPSILSQPKCKVHSFFRVVIRPSALIHSITISISFMEEHMEQKMGRAKRIALDATLKLMKKSWSVTITNLATENNKYRILKGWSKFARENELQKGDVCVFTLVNTGWVFLVSITRKGQDRRYLKP